MNRFLVITALAAALLLATGCVQKELMIPRMKGVNFFNNCIYADGTARMPQDIEDRGSANKIALPSAQNDANKKLLALVLRIARLGEIEVDKEAVWKYLTSTVVVNVETWDPKQLGEEKWKVRREAKLNGFFEGINVLLGVGKIKQKKKR
jgi:hypothetical protein